MASSKIDLSGLKHFMNSVEQYRQLLQNFRNAMELICEDARQYAESEYAQYGHSDITVSYDNGGTMATIYAKGEQVAFFEFGTGDVGNGTYPDTYKIPQSGVPITSSWVYYYDSQAKRTSHGVRGWFWDNTFRTGNQAEAEMWKTSQYIQQNARIIIKDHFRSESGG